MPSQSGNSDEEETSTSTAGHIIQFLDLTYGKGGEQPLEEGDENENDGDEEGDEDDDGGHSGSVVILATGMEDAPAALGSVTTTTDATPGRVVDTGEEHTGRWTKEEHEAFLAALQKYGKEWKKVAAKVKTRTVVQTRTHAQKYFQKLHKSIDQKGEDVTQVDMGVSTEPKKVAAYQSQQAGARVKKSKPTGTKPQRRGSAATMSAAQVITTLSNAKPIGTGAFIAMASSSMIGTVPRAHGFSMDTNATFPIPFGGASTGWRGGTMKIVAPDPSDHRSKFPEPSPAATGKRKLAEIAAARMLAGVGNADGPPTPPLTPPPSLPSAVLNLKDAPQPPFLGGFKGMPLQIVNPESLGITHVIKKKSGETSPVTPWEGDLEALVTSVADKAALAVADEEDEKILSGDSVPVNNGAIRIHPINGPADAYERSPLHQTVCSQDIISLRTLLDVVKPNVLEQLDEAGYCPLHSACAILMKEEVNTKEIEMIHNEMVHLLLANGADPTRHDSKGNSPLHWAARAGDRDAAEQLLKKSVGGKDATNMFGETPLHWAMRAGMRGAAVVSLLLETGARPDILDKSFRRPIDVASEGFIDDEGSLATLKLRDNQGKKFGLELKRLINCTLEDRKDARANLLIRSAHSRTLVLHHPECLEHHTKSYADWEAPERVTTIMRRVLPSSDYTGATETSGIFPHEITVSQEFDRANLDLLSRVHSTEYLSFVNKLSKDFERKMKETGFSSTDDSDQGTWSPPPVIPFTPMVQRSMIKVDESSIKLSDNSDTSFSAGSLRAARRAAGAVQHAVDCVLSGRNRNAFCVVRPPGHHAGINGLLEGGESCGFCIFNNVAAGALHAIYDDKLPCERCAIVDIDVHHGNGTEEIVRKCHDPSKLFFFSIHLYENDKSEKKRGSNHIPYKFYPGTGSKDDWAMNIINVPIAPLWKDPTSAAAPIKSHNTRNKARGEQETKDDSSAPSTPRINSRASDVASEAGASSSTSAPSPRHLSAAPPGRMAYRQAIQNRLLPALRAFNPDIILISTGFDAAKGDVGNARHEKGRERVGLDLEPEDYAWTTRKILEIADICCQGRVVSVLEGGYGRTPQAPAVDGVLQTLDRTVFGECAVRHLHAMVDPYDAEKRFPF